MTCRLSVIAIAIACAATASAASAAPAARDADRAAVEALDVAYQAAVERNDAAAMGRILDERFVLVLGDGRAFTREDLLGWATTRKFVYDRQAVEPGTRVVRVYGDTAVVTALLAIKGTRDGTTPVDLRLWYSDTYVRTPAGWRYVFGQASLPLKPE